MKGFVKKPRSGPLSGAYLVKRGCLGFLGLGSGRGGGLSGLVVEGGVIIAEVGVEVLHFFHVDVICGTELEFVHGGRGDGDKHC